MGRAAKYGGRLASVSRLERLFLLLLLLLLLLFLSQSANGGVFLAVWECWRLVCVHLLCPELYWL